VGRSMQVIRLCQSSPWYRDFKVSAGSVINGLNLRNVIQNSDRLYRMFICMTHSFMCAVILFNRTKKGLNTSILLVFTVIKMGLAVV